MERVGKRAPSNLFKIIPEEEIEVEEDSIGLEEKEISLVNVKEDDVSIADKIANA